MTRIRVDFLIALPIIAAIAYLIAGGVAVIAVGFLGFCLRVAPFREDPLAPDPANSGVTVTLAFVNIATAHRPVIPPRDSSPLIVLDLVTGLLTMFAGVATLYPIV